MTTIDRKMHHFSTFQKGFACVLLFLHTALFSFAQNNDGVLIFRCDENYPPYDFADKKGMATGFNIDLLREVADVADLKIEIIPGKWADIYKELKAGEIDGITGMYFSETRSADFAFSDAVRYVTHIAIYRQGLGISSFDDLAGKTLIVQTDDIMHQYVIEKKITGKIITENDVMNALQRFKQGDGDAILLNRLLFYSFQNILDVNKYTIITVPVDPLPYSFAVQKNNTVLLRKLNEGLNILASSGKFNEIYIKWFGSELTQRPQKKMPVWAWVMAGSFLLFTLVVFIWNRSLKYTVNRRTRQLKSELQAKKLAEQQHHTAVSRLNIVQNSAGMGIWELNVKTGVLFWDDGMFKLFETKRQSFEATFNNWLTLVHPDDRTKVEDVFKNCISEKTDYSDIYRILIPEGKEKHIRVFAHLAINKKGEVENAIGVSWDITSIKHSEFELREREEQFRTMYEHAPIGIALVSLDYKILNANKTYCDMLGYTNEELQQKTLQSITHPDDIEENVRLQNSLVTGYAEEINWEKRLIHKSGKTVPVILKAGLVKSIDNKPLYFIGHIIDISDRKKNELIQEILYSISQAAVLSDSLFNFMEEIRSELTKIVDTSNLFIGLLNEDDDSILLPYMKDDLQTFTSFPTRKSISRHVISNGKTMLLYDEDLENLHNNGIIERAGGRAMVWLGVPLRIQEKIIGIIVLQNYQCKDAITTDHVRILEYIAPQLSQAIKRKQDEDLIQKTTSILKEAEKIAHLGSFEWNTQTNQYIFSEEIYRLFGLDPVNKSQTFNDFLQFLHPDDESLVLNTFDSLRKGKNTFGFELRIIRSDNGEMSVLFVSGALLKHDQVLSGIYTGIVQDITGQKKIQEELIKSKERAEESDRLKSAFLANMSHEIRTPMNSIIGFSQMLPEASDDEERDKFIKIINTNGEHLLSLIDDIIDISKIEAGAMTVEEVDFDLEGLVLDCMNQFLDHSKIKSGTVLVNLEKPAITFNTNITSDFTKIRQVLTNLIFNAIKFTNAGTITVCYSLLDNNFILITVKDQGIGIPPDKIANIFDRFMQAGVDIKTSETGAGLGLTLCRAYVGLLGGKIWVESQLQKGSTFCFTLPYLPANAVNIFLPEEVSCPPLQLPEVTVLIAEDNEDNFKYLKAALRNTGFNIIRAKNGEEVVDLFKNIPGINLILMDIRMPVKNGLEATGEIKAINPNIPIIAQTAYALDGDREKALLAGCDDYISKPIRKNVLLQKVMNCLAERKFQQEG